MCDTEDIGVDLLSGVQMQFVKICQMINDQKVGVSAFIRKRQAVSMIADISALQADSTIEKKSSFSYNTYSQNFLPHSTKIYKGYFASGIHVVVVIICD